MSMVLESCDVKKWSWNELKPHWPDLTPPKLCHYASTIQHCNGLLRVEEFPLPNGNWHSPRSTWSCAVPAREQHSYPSKWIFTLAEESQLWISYIFLHRSCSLQSTVLCDSLSLAASLAWQSYVSRGWTSNCVWMNKNVDCSFYIRSTKPFRSFFHRLAFHSSILFQPFCKPAREVSQDLHMLIHLDAYYLRLLSTSNWFSDTRNLQGQLS